MRADVMSRSASFTGTTVWLRSEPRAVPCVCCGGGPHIFGKRLDIDDPELIQYDSQRNAVSQFHRLVERMPEGAHVRVTVEVIE